MAIIITEKPKILILYLVQIYPENSRDLRVLCTRNAASVRSDARNRLTRTGDDDENDDNDENDENDGVGDGDGDVHNGDGGDDGDERSQRRDRDGMAVGI